MLDRIAEIINAGSRFLIASHVRPDGDSIGSVLALYHMLKGRGKESVVYSQDKTPDVYSFLPGAEVIVHRLEQGTSFDAVFLLDCSDIDRVGDEAPAIGAMNPIINIDHHRSNTVVAPYAVIDTGASSTGEILCRLMNRAGVTITPDIAVNIYTALMTDTGSFRYSNTGSETLRMAAEMVDRGADARLIAEHIYETTPLVKIRLMERGLQTLEFDRDGTVGSIVVTRTMLEETGALPEHTEGLVDLVRSIDSVMIAVFYQEMTDGTFKASLRSKGVADVSRIAQAFGGGGHLNASACMIAGDIATVKEKLLGEIPRG